MKWIQHHAAPGLVANDLKAYLKQSYDLIVAGLPKKTRADLGI
jgi:predicted DNA-binding protein (MmcQ/YjbR family)